MYLEVTNIKALFLVLINVAAVVLICHLLYKTQKSNNRSTLVSIYAEESTEEAEENHATGKWLVLVGLGALIINIVIFVII